MDTHLSQLFKHELSLVPSAHCSEYWDMRKGNKPTLVEKLAVFSTAPLQPVDHELIDGNEAIYHTSWQGNTTVENFTTTFLTSFKNPYDMYIVFDQYKKVSHQVP